MNQRTSKTQNQLKQGKKGKDGKAKKQLVLTILKFTLLLVILVGIPLYLYFFQKDFLHEMSDLESARAYLAQYHTQSIFVYIGAQALQIIISLIPGQWLQIAAGFMYGFWLGYLFSVIGAVLGTVITYYLAKVLGKDAVTLFFGEEKFHHYREKITSKRGMVAIFIIFLIPGVPKDLCNYIAGLSNVNLKAFMIVSIIGRTPGMMGSLLIGRQIEVGIYSGAIAIGVLAIILFILGVIFREKVFHFVDRAYDKLSHL